MLTLPIRHLKLDHHDFPAKKSRPTAYGVLEPTITILFSPQIDVEYVGGGGSIGRACRVKFEVLVPCYLAPDCAAAASERYVTV
jgi:hypothetical protein